MPTKAIVAVLGLSILFSAAHALAEDQKTTTTTQQAADAKKREGKTGTSHEGAANNMKEVDKELEQQRGKGKN